MSAADNGASPRLALTVEVELTGEQLDLLAAIVAEKLRSGEHAPSRIVDASQLAAELGVSRDYIYAHATELGGLKVGDGPRPRWRFDRSRARDAWQSPSEPERTTPRRRRSANGRAGLLPVHGEDNDSTKGVQNT